MRNKNKKLTIVYVGNFDENSIGEPEIAKCLEELGHIVYRLQEKKTNIEEIISVIEQIQADFLLYAKLRIRNNYNEIRDFLESLKVPKIMWNFDKYFCM